MMARLRGVGALIGRSAAQDFLRVLQGPEDELVGFIRIARIAPHHAHQFVVEGTHRPCIPPYRNPTRKRGKENSLASASGYFPIMDNTSSRPIMTRLPSSNSTINLRASTSWPSTRACPLFVTMRAP